MEQTCRRKQWFGVWRKLLGSTEPPRLQMPLKKKIMWKWSVSHGYWLFELKVIAGWNLNVNILEQFIPFQKFFNMCTRGIDGKIGLNWKLFQYKENKSSESYETSFHSLIGIIFSFLVVSHKIRCILPSAAS